MRVFVTGASGWIGSAVVPELLAGGHEVVGLARSEESAQALRAAGAEVRRGGLDDLAGLRAAAEAADGVIHLGYKHDFSDMAGAARTERAVIETLVGALEGSDRPLLFASGVAGVVPGGVLTESDSSPFIGAESPRGGAEHLALSSAERGVGAVALRFAPTVHGDGDHGFLSRLVEIAREKGASGYVGDGANRWPAVHRLDAARMVALALEKAPAGVALHAVGEEGVVTRQIAEAIGRHLAVPVVSVAADDVSDHFGWIGGFFALDLRATSMFTQRLLDWTPTHPGLLDDLDSGSYFRDALVSE